MSSLWLGLALVGTFLTVVLVGVVIDMFLREKHRPVSLLQAQVGEVQHVPDLREEALQGSAFQRAVMPGAVRLGRAVDRLLPYDMHKRVDELLVYAGSPVGFDAGAVRAAMDAPEVLLRLDLGLGTGTGEGFGCDLTEAYVRENAEYTT